MSELVQQVSSASTISRYFHRLAPLGLTKYVQLRQSIINALDDGELQYQEKLPPERELGDMLSISLGTTQKALTGLAADGYVLRKQGIGTFAGQSRHAIKKAWHYRFTDPQTGQHLPVFARFLKRTVVGTGAWSKHLGPDPAGYIRIDRSISIDDRFSCFSELYLPASLFQSMLHISEARLHDINLKQVLETECGYSTTEAKGGARLIQLDARIASIMDLPRETWVLKINILGKANGQAISYQKMFVPPTNYELDMDFVSSS